MSYYIGDKTRFYFQKQHVTHYRAIAFLFLLFALLPKLALGQSLEKTKVINERIPTIFEIAKSKTRQTISTLAPNRFPITTSTNSKWKTTDSGGWTSGFFPGILWLLYEQSGNAVFKQEAIKRQNFLASQQYNTKTHDVGFIVFSSFGNGYRLTGNDKYRAIIVQAARSLSSRYNKKTGLIQSWESLNNTQRTIIDNLMNLPILFWTSENGGDKELKNIAISHAQRTAKDFIRANGSTYHLINYDIRTGKIISKTSAQGLSPQSSWARGQAWAIYGFALAYKETGNSTFLTAARKTANYFIKNLPADFVPYWDFSVPKKQEAPRDTSAAAIAASGLLELSTLEKSPAYKKQYLEAAQNILLSLSSKNYLSNNKKENNILLHGTYNKNVGDFDTGTIWGDFYFLEALLKHKKTTQS